MSENGREVGKARNTIARRRVAAPSRWVDVGELSGRQTRIRVVSPAIPAVDLGAWIEGHRGSVDQWLASHGGVLFRGFDVDLDTSFSRIAGLLICEFQAYMEGATPRTLIGNGVYTSTEFPSDQAIAPHNELSYVMNWPMQISFACRQPAEEGGETPLTDVRSVLRNIDSVIVERFSSSGWMLVRNYGNGLGPTWQKAFNTESLDSVREYCARGCIELEVLSPERIRTRQVRPAVRRHPLTGDAVWFNHIAFWHPASLQRSVREGLAAQFSPEEFPYYTCWGDGAAIDDDIIEHLNTAYRKATLITPWRRNDILLLDNMLIAHGRMPFRGRRSIVVAMGEPYSADGAQ